MTGRFANASKENDAAPHKEAAHLRTHGFAPSASPIDILTLQRVAGNRLVNGMLKPLTHHEPVAAADIPPVASAVTGTNGQPLNLATRTEMESRFGYDLTNVRVHSDDSASQAALTLNARAFTVGRHIFFGSQYGPSTNEGRRLLAHELTHVIQQNGVSSHEPVSVASGSSSDVLEDEARMHENTTHRADTGVKGRLPSLAVQRDEDEPRGPASKSSPKAAARRQVKRTGHWLVVATKGAKERPLLLSKNTVVEVSKVEGEWVRVKVLTGVHAGRTGAIQQTHLTAVKEPVEAQDVTERSIPPPSLAIRRLAEQTVREGEPLDLPFGKKKQATGVSASAVVGAIVESGTPMRESIEKTHWASEQALHQFMDDYIAYAAGKPHLKHLADQAVVDREIIVRQLQIARLEAQEQLFAETYHVEDVKKLVKVQTPAPILARAAPGEVARQVGQAIAPVIDIGIRLIPVLGQVIDLTEIIGGRSLSILTFGEKLPDDERIAQAAMLVMMMIPFSRAVSGVGSQGPRVIGEVARRSGRSTEEIARVLRYARRAAAKEGAISKIIGRYRQGHKLTPAEQQMLAEVFEAGAARKTPPASVVKPAAPLPPATKRAPAATSAKSATASASRTPRPPAQSTKQVSGAKPAASTPPVRQPPAAKSTPRAKSKSASAAKRAPAGKPATAGKPAKRPSASPPKHAAGAAIKPKPAAAKPQPTKVPAPKRAASVPPPAKPTRAVPPAKGFNRLSSASRSALAKVLSEPRARKSLAAAGDDIISAINKFHSVPGFDQVVASYVAGGNKQQGARFVMRFVEKEFASAPKGMAFEVASVGRRRIIDLFVNDVRYEFKSRLDIPASIITGRGKGPQIGQLQRDLTQLLSQAPPQMFSGKLKWVFDSARLRGMTRNDVIRTIQQYLSQGIFRNDPRAQTLMQALDDIVMLWP